MDTAPHENPGPDGSPSGGSTGGDPSASPAPSSAPDGGSVPHLHRVGRGRMLGGVAAGLADYFDVDPTMVRIGFVALAFLGGLAVPLYVAGWVLIPDEDSDVSVAEELLARERARGAY
jgi:phage shock protein PspC (stress-responsive transcriptional regulator)